MESYFSSQLKNLEELENKNIKYENYGSDLGFFDTEELKNRIVFYIKDLIARLIKQEKNIDKSIYGIFQEQINKVVNKLRGQIANIEQLVNQGVNNPNYPQTRLQYKRDIERTNIEARRDLLNIEVLLNTLEESETLKDLKMSLLPKDLQELKKKSKEESDEIHKILTNLQDVSAKKGITEGIETFDLLKENYEKRENRWFMSMIACGFLTLVALIYILFYMPDFDKNDRIISQVNNIQKEKIDSVIYYKIIENVEKTNTGDFLIYIFKKLMIVLVPVVFFKVSMTKYNIERHLRVIYDHRATVLRQYKDFENAIGDDSTAKNQFRMEIAKYIFSDPQTGYIKDNPTSDVNFNPVLALGEKLISKQ